MAEPSLFEDVERCCGKEDATIARRILDRAGIPHYRRSIWTYGSTEVQFHWEMRKPPFDRIGKRREWLGRLNRVPALNIPEERLGKRPSFPLPLLRDAAALERFDEMFDGMAGEITSA